jgi:hypothetical protein
MYMHVCTYKQIYMYVYMYIHTYIHTYIANEIFFFNQIGLNRGIHTHTHTDTHKHTCYLYIHVKGSKGSGVQDVSLSG